ncbi:hypothetical protein ATANTOWER_030631, partial [Ataeniobius toweri]|nr:hypothetical protein [Ataeniobius toweri]
HNPSFSKSLGRETKYASLCSLHSSANKERKLTDTEKTKPGMIRPMTAIPRLTEEIEERFKSISLRKFFKQAIPDKKKLAEPFAWPPALASILRHSQSRPCCMSPGSDLDSSHLAQLSVLLPQHDSLLPPPPPSTSSGSTLKSSCQASSRFTSSTLAPAAHSCLSSACSFSSDLRLSNRSSRTSSFDVFFYSSHPSTFSASCISSMDSVQHSIHLSTSPEFASNLAMSASSSPLYRRPACSSAPPTGVHLANARPCLSLANPSLVYLVSYSQASTPSQDYIISPPRLARLDRSYSLFSSPGSADSTSSTPIRLTSSTLLSSLLPLHSYIFQLGLARHFLGEDISNLNPMMFKPSTGFSDLLPHVRLVRHSPIYALSGTAPSMPYQAQPRLCLIRHSPVYALSGTAPSMPCQALPHVRLVRHSPIYALSGTALSTPCQAQPHLRLVRHSPIYALSGTAPSTPCQAKTHRRLEEELRKSGEAKYAHLNNDLHVLIEVFAPPGEAYSRMSHALEEIKKFLVPDYNDEIRQEQLRELSLLNGSDESSRGRSIQGRSLRTTTTASIM